MKREGLLGAGNLEELALALVALLEIETTPLGGLQTTTSVVKGGVIGIDQLEITGLAPLETAQRLGVTLDGQNARNFHLFHPDCIL